MANTFPLTEMS